MENETIKMNLHLSKKELEIAKKSLFQMQLTNDFDKLEDHWRDLLNRLERCYDKAVDACHSLPNFQAWISKYHSLRKKDPLLSYMKQARNAGTHTIKEIVDKKEMQQRFISKEEQQRLIVDGIITEESEDMWQIYPKTIELICVTNRGVKYLPPEHHLGEPTSPLDPLWNGHIAILFYEQFLADIESSFYE